MPRIMVADDDEDIRSLIETVLEDHEVVFAEDGDEAYRMAREQMIDLIIMDVAMPMMDGIEACRTIKDDPSTAGVPVLMLTAKAGFDDRVAGEEAHAEAYLTKPFDPYQLQKMVEHLLEVAKTRGA